MPIRLYVVTEPYSIHLYAELLFYATTYGDFNMELILILLLLMSQNKDKNGKPALDLQKLAPVLTALGSGENTFLDLSMLKNLDLGSLLNGNFDLSSLFSNNSNLSNIINAVSAFSSFAQSATPAHENVQNNTMPPLQPISKIANANITYALNSYFSE